MEREPSPNGVSIHISRTTAGLTCSYHLPQAAHGGFSGLGQFGRGQSHHITDEDAQRVEKQRKEQPRQQLIVPGKPTYRLQPSPSDGYHFPMSDGPPSDLRRVENGMSWSYQHGEHALGNVRPPHDERLDVFDRVFDDLGVILDIERRLAQRHNLHHTAARARVRIRPLASAQVRQ